MSDATPLLQLVGAGGAAVALAACAVPLCRRPARRCGAGRCRCGGRNGGQARTGLPKLLDGLEWLRVRRAAEAGRQVQRGTSRRFVNMSTVFGQYEKVLTAIAGGNPPDVVSAVWLRSLSRWPRATACSRSPTTPKRTASPVRVLPAILECVVVRRRPVGPDDHLQLDRWLPTSRRSSRSGS